MSKTIHTIFLLVIITLPFTDFAGIKALGEHKQDLAAHILLVGVGVYYLMLFLKKKITPINSIIYQLYVLFFVWCIFAYFFNYTSISTSLFKGRAGNRQFINQMIIYGMSIFGFVPFFHYVIGRYSSWEIIRLMRKYMYYVLFFVFFVVMLEILIGWYQVSFLKPLYDFIHTAIMRESGSEPSWSANRVTGVTYEPPYLAMYLMVVLPFMLTYIYDNRKKLFTVALVFILVFLSGSRTALIVCIIQLFIFIVLLMRYVYTVGQNVKFLEKIVIASIVILPIIGGVVIEKIGGTISSLKLEKKYRENSLNVSNITRMATQLTAIEIFKEHPVTGVGLGQQGFYYVKNYPDWAVKLSYELRDQYMNPTNPIWPPGYSLYTRLLCETGIIGFFLFIGTSLLMGYIGLRRLRQGQEPIVLVMLLSLLAGQLLNSIQFDSLRSIPFWLLVSFMIVVINKKQRSEK